MNIQGNWAKAEVPVTVVRSGEGYRRPGQEFDSQAGLMGYFELVKRGSRWLISDYKFNML